MARAQLTGVLAGKCRWQTNVEQTFETVWSCHRVSVGSLNANERHCIHGARSWSHTHSFVFFLSPLASATVARVIITSRLLSLSLHYLPRWSHPPATAVDGPLRKRDRLRRCARLRESKSLSNVIVTHCYCLLAHCHLKSELNRDKNWKVTSNSKNYADSKNATQFSMSLLIAMICEIHCHVKPNFQRVIVEFN